VIDPKRPDFSNTPVSGERPACWYAPAEIAVPPVVSIVTPFFDSGDLFRETVAAVFRQSFQQWEWIVVNDGSTDPASLSALADARAADPRVRVVDLAANRGPSAARNAGVDQARGRYVLLLDSDDLLEPTAVEVWLWYLESHPGSGFVHGYTVGFGEQRYLWDGGFRGGRRLLLGDRPPIISLLRIEVYRAAGGFDESIRDGLEDWDFWSRCASIGFHGGTVPLYLAWYRRRRNHADRWRDWDGGARESEFARRLRRRYSRLSRAGSPAKELDSVASNEEIGDEKRIANRLVERRRRLLLLIPWMTTGGADKFNLDLVGQLTARGWQVSIVTTRAGDHAWLPQFAALSPDVFVTSHFLPLDVLPRFLVHLVRSRGIEAVLVSNSELGYSLLPYLRAHCPKVAFFDYCHCEEPAWKAGGYPALSVAHRDDLHLHTVASRHLADWMTARGADREKIEVVTANVDADFWRPDSAWRAEERRLLGIDSSTPIILFAGRLVAQKQPRVLGGVVRRLVRDGAEFVAVVAGDGPDLRQVRSLVAGRSVANRVRFVGAVPIHRMRRLMSAADIFFLPSKWEGISLAIYEAMASGLPIVSADVGGQSELVSPDCGYLIASSNEDAEVEAYARVLLRLIADGDERRRMGKQGLARVRSHFRLDAMGERMDSLLRRVCQMSAVSQVETPLLSEAAACAARAVEVARLEEASASRWSRDQLEHQPAASGWRRRIYVWAYERHRPFYEWYSRRGWTWIEPLRVRVKSWLGAA